jgi:hypothetical protein
MTSVYVEFKDKYNTPTSNPFDVSRVYYSPSNSTGTLDFATMTETPVKARVDNRDIDVVIVSCRMGDQFVCFAGVHYLTNAIVQVKLIKVQKGDTFEDKRRPDIVNIRDADRPVIDEICKTLIKEDVIVLRDAAYNPSYFAWLFVVVLAINYGPATFTYPVFHNSVIHATCMKFLFWALAVGYNYVTGSGDTVAFATRGMVSDFAITTAFNFLDWFVYNVIGWTCELPIQSLFIRFKIMCDACFAFEIYFAK